MGIEGSSHAQVMRALNDRIVELLHEIGSEDSDFAQFLCECGNVTCLGTIDLTLQEYGALGGQEDRSPLKLPGHPD